MRDPITGLSIQSSPLDEAIELALRRAREQGTAMALMIVDLAPCQQGNLLTAVADRVRRYLRVSDHAGHFGDDEVAILLEDLGGADEADSVAARIASAMREPIVVDGSMSRVSVRIGAVVSDDGEASVEQILRRADVARHEAKSRRCSYVRWTPYMSQRPGPVHLGIIQASFGRATAHG